ncbi:MAG: hypothetical protein OXC00_16505 [Acidimicrobiaceae bacterium]|nr:hypothetical protein [Acidimicrobiaceae bacterium]
MSMRRRTVWVLAAAVVLVVSGCGSSADPDTWAEAEQDDRFLDEEFGAKSAVEHNFMASCIEANTENLTEAQARVLCRCSFDGLRNALVLEEFRALDNALRSTPNPSDLDEEPEDLWDDTAEDIFNACARRVDA